MKLGTMLQDVLRSLFRQPATEKYPSERRQAPTMTRGKLNWDPENCTGCGLCGKDCPADAIELIVLDRKEKRFVMRYHVDRCTFCGQCVHSCRFNCLELSPTEWELAATTKESFTQLLGQEKEIAEFLEDSAEPDAEPAAQAA